MSSLVAFVGFDMLLLRSRHQRPQIEEDKERYGDLGANLSVEHRSKLELAIGVSTLNLRTVVAVALAASGSVGVVTGIYLLLFLA